MSFPGRINEYRCDDCEGVMVTIDVDEGDTPFFARCQLAVRKQVDATTRLVGATCGGRCYSSMYDCDQARPAHYAWRRPTPHEAANLRGFERWQVGQGQLILRPR